MTGDDVITIIDLDDDFDGEALDICLESTKQDVANLQESYRKCKNKVKQEIGRLHESRDKYRREYLQELAQRQKDKDSWLQKSAGQSSVIKDLKLEKAVLSASNKQLRLELKAIKQRLDRMGHLICDICMEQEKCTVTKCGHGFCSDCLDEVIHYAAVTCPTCQKELDQERDLWPIYLTEEWIGLYLRRADWICLILYASRSLWTSYFPNHLAQD